MNRILITSIFLIILGSTFFAANHAMAFGLSWERVWGGNPTSQMTDLVVHNISDPNTVYAITAHIWNKYDKNGNFISSSSVVTNPRDIEISGNNYYVAYNAPGGLRAAKLDSTTNILQNFTYTSSSFTSYSSQDVTVDSNNNVYVMGYGLSSGGIYTPLVVKFNSVGTVLWVHNPRLTGDSEGFWDGQVVGSHVYVVGSRITPAGSGITRMRVIKYSATSTQPAWDFDNQNAGGTIPGVYPCSVRTFNNQVYSICNSGEIHQISTVSGSISSIASAYPVSGCSNLAYQGTAFIASSGIVWTAGACNVASSPAQFRTYVSRFNLVTASSSGPFYITPLTETYSWPTRTGGTALAENDTYAYAAGTKGGGGSLDYALWRVTGLTCTGPLSFPNWTDGPDVVSGVTNIKAIHINELRSRIHTLQIDAGLPTSTWTDPTLAVGLPIRRTHFEEMRNAVNGVYQMCGQSTPAWTDSSLSSSTAVRAVHLNELRDRVEAAP